jgi:hypothetical protein
MRVLLELGDGVDSRGNTADCKIGLLDLRLMYIVGDRIRTFELGRWTLSAISGHATMLIVR